MSIFFSNAHFCLHCCLPRAAKEDPIVLITPLGVMTSCSFITKNRQQWLEEAAAGDSTASTDSTDGSSSSPSLEQCVESLYLEAEHKLEAAGKIASLLSADIHDDDTDATDAGTTSSKTESTKTLALVAGNGQLLSALTRMLREDCVSSHLCQIFFHLSLFPAYHPLLLSHGIGSLLLDLLVRETKRDRCIGGEDDGHGEETRDDQSTSFDAVAVARAADTDADTDAITCSSRGSSSTVTAISSARSSSSSSGRRRTFSSKQEKIILLCLAILKNLADDVNVRRKMLKSGQLMAPLLASLKCKTTDCVVRSLLLLRKASLYEEVVADFAQQNDGKTLRAIIRLATEEGETVIVDHALRLLFNVSFHRDCRKIMANTPKLIDVLSSVTRSKDSPSRQVCVKLLKVLCLEMLDEVSLQFHPSIPLD